MKARGCLAVLVCATAGLAVPVGATAKPGYYISPHLHYADAHLKGSNGYQLEIDGFSTNVNVNARKGDGQVSYTVYRGHHRNDRMRARLPGIGWINLRFHELERIRKQPSEGCSGPGELVRRGVFRGRIHIEGELGYTQVDTQSARGRILDDPEQFCRNRIPSARASAEPGEELIEAVSPWGRGALSFEANEWSPSFGGTPVFFSAATRRQRGMMMITNAVGGFTEDTRSLVVAQPPLSATVSPPSPFTGTAEFLRGPDERFGWFGDLAAELPGIGPVALAGENFEARICDGRSCKSSVRLPKDPFQGPIGELP
ncbi:MAG TPA: hypothetical protein VIT89_02815 [Solirubrobacterales bacterium]